MYYFKQKDNLNKYLSQAFAFHGLVVLLIILSTFWVSFTPDKVKRMNDIKVIQTAVRIDIVGLPKHTLKELKLIDLNQTVPTEKAEKRVESNETSKVEYKKVTKKISMKSLLGKYSEKKVVSPKKQQKNLKIDQFKNIIMEGNKISQGSSSTGETIEASEQEFVRYIQSLPDKVRPHWKLPSYLLDSGLRCRIRIFLAINGKINKVEIYESSGEDEYDAKAMQAVKKSSPLPAPSKNIHSRVVSGDIILGFPL